MICCSGKKKNIQWRVIFYTLLFGFICLISQRVHTAAPPDGWAKSFRDMLGFPIAALILSHYKWEDLKKYKRYHSIWGIAGGIGCIVLFMCGKNTVAYIHDWFVIVAEIFVWGFVLIQTLFTVFKEKIRPSFNKGITAVWVVMMLWMVVSRSDEMWPLPYLIVFLCFYLTDFSKQEKKQSFQGILNGIIVSFFVFQAHCFLYRPYDEVRYKGWFTNSNSNSLYYCFVLAAVLVKLYMCYQKSEGKWWRIYYWLGVGTVFSFEIMTIGRIGWITAFVLAFLFLVFQKRNFGKSIIKNGIIIILCTCLTFPLCFGAARYIPPLRHHVYWFYGEWSEEKVHSWDKWDSEKFVDIDEFGDAALGRISQSLGELWKHMPFVVETHAAALEDREIPVLDEQQGRDSLLVRTTIYRTFWEGLNFTGHNSEEIGFQLTETFWVYHAHSIYLQFGTQFGIPVMVMFVILIAASLRKCWMDFKRTHSVETLGYGYFILIPALFGLLEYTWGAGHMAITLLFIAWRMVLVKDKDAEDSRQCIVNFEGEEQNNE